jgi:hypothetical protein
MKQGNKSCLLLRCEKYELQEKLFFSVRTRFGRRRLQNPLGYASFGFETADDAEVETMEEDVRAVSLRDQREPVQQLQQQQQGSGGAVGKFKKKDKKKKNKKQF